LVRAIYLYFKESRKNKRGGRGRDKSKERSGSKDKKENASDNSEEKKVSKDDSKKPVRERKNIGDIRCFNCD
jgi:hypothetical protein